MYISCIYIYLFIYCTHHPSEYEPLGLLLTRFPKALVSSQPKATSDVLESTSSLLGWKCCTPFFPTFQLRDCTCPPADESDASYVHLALLPYQ